MHPSSAVCSMIVIMEEPVKTIHSQRQIRASANLLHSGKNSEEYSRLCECKLTQINSTNPKLLRKTDFSYDRMCVRCFQPYLFYVQSLKEKINWLKTFRWKGTAANGVVQIYSSVQVYGNNSAVDLFTCQRRLVQNYHYQRLLLWFAEITGATLMWVLWPSLNDLVIYALRVASTFLAPISFLIAGAIVPLYNWMIYSRE